MTVTDSLAEISSEAELRELLGTPMPRAATKERVRLHDRDKDWLAASPFVVEIERYYGPQYATRIYG